MRIGPGPGGGRQVPVPGAVIRRYADYLHGEYGELDSDYVSSTYGQLPSDIR